MRTQLCFQTFIIPFYLLLFGVDMILVSGQCQLDQRLILIQLKHELNFNTLFSKKLVSWNPNITTDCCNWKGVDCSITGQVIGLDLSNETISGGIDNSSALFNLKNLESLNLAANNFNFSHIPSRFDQFTSLSYLNLSNSRFSGQIPEELSQLKSLEILDLSALFSSGIRSLKLENPNLATLVQNLTRLTGLYLDNVDISSQRLNWGQGLSSSLPNLEVLSLSNCQLSGPLDESLEKMQSLSTIYLALNDLSTSVPEFFASYKNLTVMNLGSCNLIGTFPVKVLQLQTLKFLDLSSNMKLHGSLPEFAISGSLQSLVIGNTNFSGGLPESIGTLQNLSRIELQLSNFSGKIPKSMEQLTKLVYLDLSSNSLTGEIPSFQLCKNLTHIDLSRNGLSGMIPSGHFEGLENLVLVDLRFNRFNGSIPSSLFSLQLLRKIQLSDNDFGGLLPNFSNPSKSLLDTLDLSSNKFGGGIPKSWFELRKLSILLLSSNNLSGIIRIVDFQDRFSYLTTLDLSFNDFTIKTSENITLDDHLPKFLSLKLAACNLVRFPNLRNQPTLINVDLSQNKIEGPVPHWIWEVGVGNGGLSYMNLSHNRLTSLEEPYQLPALSVLDLHFNNISGMIPIPPQTATYIDYSQNLFNSSLPESIGTNLSYTYFFSVSSNLLTGVIPDSICNAIYLKVLDLSNNRLNGSIPRCLIESSGSLGVLNLANNNLNGQIEGTFPNTCGLNTLDLHNNALEGKIWESLVNCTVLEVLNIGNNRINDTYPCSLGNLTTLRVLILRSNMFHGSVNCSQNQDNNSWSNLQIVDIAYNSFKGAIPVHYFMQLGAMMSRKQSGINHLSFTVLPLSDFYYQDTVTVTVKGLELELVKILTLFTSIDISSNRFSGVIPSTIGRLKALYLLNISHNEFSGTIPSSMGNLSQLEALDMSSNRLSGVIPSALTRLPFLSKFNLSYNHLQGKIPTGSQFQTFENNSYLGNRGLCGFPLTTGCNRPVAPPVSSNTPSTSEFDWLPIFFGSGVVTGLLIVIVISCSVCKSKTF